MATLLRIDSSPLGSDASFSRQLTHEFVQHWQRTHADGKLITRDLVTTKLQPLSAEWIGAAHTPEAALSPNQQDVVSLSNQLTAALESADEYVSGVAMHNFSIPAVLKLWIDQIARAGKTFSYGEGGVQGLLQGKKATVLMASGGVYELGTPSGALNFVEPYLRAVLGFLGVKDVKFVTAGGVAQI